MTPDQFMQRAGVEKALNEQMKATGQVVTDDTLRGCLMAAVQMAHRLKLPQADFITLAQEEWGVLEHYLKAKADYVKARKKQKEAKR